jgi:hypothetical protein
MARLWSITELSSSEDMTWNYPLLNICSMVEVCIAIITSSIPSLYRILRQFFRSPFDTTHGLSQATRTGQYAPGSQMDDRSRKQNITVQRDVELQSSSRGFEKLSARTETSVRGVGRESKSSISESSEEYEQRSPMQQQDFDKLFEQMDAEKNVR